MELKAAFNELVGNLALRERLRDDICANRLSHAYILEGVSGSGKHTLARSIAAALACLHRHTDGEPLPCGSCPACKKILSGNSPDLITVNRGEKATFGIEAIRTMQSDVYIAPNECEDKIYLIEEAHLMTVQAQNAFLLTLEEPPAYVRFFLLCESASSLLETVRSRAPTLRMEQLSSEAIGAYLQKNEPAARSLLAQSPQELSELLAAADGSIGKAKQLLDPKLRKPIMEQRAAARVLLDLCGDHHNSAALLSFLNGLGTKRDEIIAQLNVILLCMRDLLLCKQTEQAPLCFFSDREEALNRSYRFSAPELMRICDSLCDVVDRLRMNANVRLTMTHFALQLGSLS